MDSGSSRPDQLPVDDEEDVDVVDPDAFEDVLDLYGPSGTVHYLVHGGEIVKRPIPVPRPGYPNDGSYSEDKGHTALAILLPETVLLAVNYHSSGPAIADHIGSVGPRMIASFSGGEDVECTKLLHDLQNKCSNVAGERSVEETVQIMTNMLASHLEVGLIAGWDGEKDCPFSYRIDGMGGVIKGEITGHWISI
ncbi:OLC1v1037763C1 [Oldenlandia corymbosa var. corymbosa]|uniref:OLC1v1037763C1 n=1 Tax=Oldenlandia corymbosa var. corymbosa TaxID=529605 RepID=A0AAV1CYA6_OLDCO|nr:OLC1v1037763C1 [Oldenlandia corymbosa var. corymbosa]